MVMFCAFQAFTVVKLASGKAYLILLLIRTIRNLEMPYFTLRGMSSPRRSPQGSLGCMEILRWSHKKKEKYGYARIFLPSVDLSTERDTHMERRPRKEKTQTQVLRDAAAVFRGNRPTGQILTALANLSPRFSSSLHA